MRSSYFNTRSVSTISARSTKLVALLCFLLSCTVAMAGTVTYQNGNIYNAPNINTSNYDAVYFVITDSSLHSYTKNLSGSGIVNYSGAATGYYLKLTGNNSDFSGTFTMSPSTSSGAAMYFSSTTAGSGNATWKFENNTFVRANLTTNGTIQLGALEGSGRLRNDESTKGVTVTYEIGGANKDATFSGLIENEFSGHNSGTYTAVTKVGTGTQTLTGANTYTGATQITDGTLRLEGDGNIASTSSVNISASAEGKVATLEFAQTSGTVNFSKEIKSEFYSRDPSQKYVNTGTIKKSGGATLNLTGKLYKSSLVTTAGTLNIGTSTTANTNANELGYLNIGGTTSDNATVNYYGGTGSLTLAEYVSGHYVGSADNGTGTLNICSGTIKSKVDLYIGSGSTSGSGVYTANGSVTVKNGAKLEATSLHVGDDGNGQLTIEAGGTVTTSKGMVVNEHTLCTSSATNNGTLTIAGNLKVGAWGNGTLTNDTEGTMNVTGATIIGLAGNASTSGTLINNGSITVNTYVEVGSEENGIGELILNTGSTFTANNSSNIHLSTQSNKNGSGTLTVNGGTLSAENSTLFLNNNITSTSTASFEIKNNGSVTLNKIVIGNEKSVAGSTATLTLNNGTLSVSDVEVYSSNVTNVINLGDGTVITGSANENNGCWWGATNVNLTSESGTKIQVDSGKTVNFNSTMTGDGGIEKTGDGTLSLSYRTKEYTGKTTVSAGTLNLMYENVLANSSEVINNAAITISEDTYQKTTPNQTLNNLSGTGTIDANNHALTLYNDKDTTYTGTISNASSLSTTGTGVITLTQSVKTDTVKVDAGTLRFSDGTSPNAVTYQSNLTVGEDGNLDFNFYEFKEGTEFDQLTLNGDLTLDGDNKIAVTFKTSADELAWHTNLLDSVAGDANGYKLISMANTAYLGDLNKYLDGTGLSQNWTLTGTDTGIFLTAVAPQPGSGVPEPSTWVLLLLGLAGLMKFARKK